MAGFGAKVKLTVDKSGKKAFNEQINSMVGQIKVSNKFTVLQKDMDRVRREAQTMLNKEPFILKVKKIDCSAAITDVKRQLQGMLSALSVSNGVNITGLKGFLGTEGVDAALKRTADGANAAVTKLNQAKAVAAEWAGQMKVLDGIAKSLSATYRSGLSGKNMISNAAEVNKITAEYNKWQQKIEQVRASHGALSAEELSNLQKSGVAIQRKITSLQNEQAERAKAAAAAQKAAVAEEENARRAANAADRQIASTKQISALYERLSKYLHSNSKISSSFYGTNIKSMMDTLSSGRGISISELTQMEEQFARIRSEITRTGLAGRSFFDSLNRAYQKFGGWMLITRSLMAAIRAVKNMIKNVRNLDTAMTELRKVTDATDKEYAAFFDRATVRAKKLGATVSDTINASADFARLGYTMEESADLADAALVYKNVGDGISDIGEASESVISTMKAFNIEATDAMFIVDKFNEVGNNFAISSKGVGDALLRSASAMASANNTLDETIALITAANSVVQDPDKVGTALKTVSMFLRAAKTEAEEAGESTDGMASSVSKLREELLLLTGGKVDIQIDKNTFKSTYQIMKEISQVWDDLTDITQANILERLGGKRNSNVVAALISNFKIAEDVLTSSANAAGSALSENEKYLDSINGKVSQFQAAFEKLSATFISSDFVKGVVDFGTGIVETLTTIIEKLGSIPTLAATISGVFTLYRSAKGRNIGLFDVVDGNKIGIANNSITTLIGNFKSAKAAGLDFSSSLRTALSGAWSGASSSITKYNQLLGSSSETQHSFMAYIESSDDSLAAYFKTLNGGTASLSGYKAYCRQAGIETSSLGVKSKAAAVGVTILNTALNMIISMGVAMVIQGIVAAITKLINKQKEAREAAIQAGSEAAENADKLYDLASAYIELANAMDAGVGSRTQFMSLQDELIEYLGLEGKTVRELTGEYSSLREAMIAAAREQLQTDISLGAAAMSSAKENAIKELAGPYGGKSGGFISATGDEVKEALEHLEKLGFSGIDNSGSRGGIIFLPNSTIDDLSSDVSFDQLMENYDYIERAMNEVSQKFGAENPVAKQLSDLYNIYHDSMSEAVSQIKSTNEMIAQDALLAAQAMSNPQTQEEFETFRKEIISSVEGYSNFEDAGGIYSAEDVVDSVLKQNALYSDFIAALEEREITAEEIRGKIQTITDAIIPKDFESLESGTAAHFHSLENWTAKAAELKNKLTDLSNEELDVAFDAVEHGATSWDEITEAIDKYNDSQKVAQRHSEKLKKSIQAIWTSDGFSDAKEDLLEMAMTLDGITPKAIEDLAENSTELAELLNEDGMNAQFLAHILQSMAEGGPGLELITTDALELNAALDGMVSKFDQVTAAKGRYDAAMAVEEKDTDFRSYAEAFEELNKQFEAGTTNSNAFWAAAQFLFGSDQLAAWGWGDGLNKIYAAMEKNKKVFSDAESAGAGFIERLYEMSEAGELVNEQGERLINISKDATGAYDFDIDPENLDKIAKKMGITEEAVLSCLKALSMWGDINFYDMNEVAEAIEKLGLSAEIAGEKAINVSALTDQLISLGKTDKEINDILTDLAALNGVTFIDAEGNIDGLTESLTNLNLATNNGVTISVNADGLSDLLSSINFTKDEAQKLIEKLSEADGITLTNASGEVQDVAGALKYIDTLDFATVTEKVDGVAEAVDDVDKSSTDNAVSELEDVGSAAETAADKVTSVATAMHKLNGTTATVEIDVRRKNGILGNLLGFAKGTDHAPQGKALLGEEGAELVQSDDSAYLAGANGPEIVNLDAGARVFTAKETKDIFARSGQRILGTIPAYAGGYDGRATTTGLRVETNKTGKVGTPYKVVVDVDKTSVENKSKDVLDKLEDQLNEILGNLEHKIFLMSKNGAKSNEIVAVYRKMQEVVHAQAEKYRKLGLDDNSDYIQALQKQWWGYEDNIRETITKSYEDILSEKENLIGKNERLYTEAISNDERAKAEEYAANILQIYREMQNTVHEQAEYYRSLGYSETSDELSDLGELWWEYADKINEVKQKTVDNLLDMVSAVSDSVDEIQNVYDTLKDAANEYAENGGFISVDAFQKIVELGPQYMQYLEDENGLLVINEENINRVIAAKTQQLALENAMAYVERLRLALNGESLENLNTLLYAATEGTNATWGLVYANLALLNLNGDQYQAALHNINAIRSMADNAVRGIGQIAGTVSNELNDMKDGLDSILEYVMDMLKQRIEDEVDALEDMKDAYADIIELRKESLETAQEEDKYQDKVASKIKEIAKLQERINALSLDDSRDAQSQKIKLEEEMAELQKELADTQSDYAVDAQTESLDKMQDAYEKEKDKEISILEESISSYQKLYDMAINYIETHWDTLYSELISWNTEYGDVLNSEITTAWDNCLAAARRYGDYVSALGQIGTDIESIGGSGASGNNSFENSNYSPEYSRDDAVRSIISRMYANSRAHGSASPERKKELSDENLRLGAQLAQYGIIAMRDQNGYWHVDSMSGPGLFDVYNKYTKYHNGGIAGDQPTLKQNEVMAILEKGEPVLDKKKEKGLYRIIDFTTALAERFGNAIGALDLPSLFGGMRSDFETVHSKSLNSVSGTKSQNVKFGNVYIYGADDKTVEKHREINRQFTNDILKQLNIKR